MHIIHRWEMFADWEYNKRWEGGRAKNGLYRTCKKCGKWQRHYGYFDGSYEWRDCIKPLMELESYS